MTLAAVDRPVHQAAIFELNVESSRRRAAIERNQGPARPTRATIKSNADRRSATITMQQPLLATLHPAMPTIAATPRPLTLIVTLRSPRSSRYTQRHLASFASWMRADAYAGATASRTDPGPSTMVARLAHVRRKVVDVHRAQGSAIAEEAIGRIAGLHAVEPAARSRPPGAGRPGSASGCARPRPGLSSTSWKPGSPPSLSGKSPLVGAIRHALVRLPNLRPTLDQGVLEIDDSEPWPAIAPPVRGPWRAAERALRGVVLGRKTYLFVGSQAGGRAAAIATTPIQTAKLDGVDPQARLADDPARILDDNPTILASGGRRRRIPVVLALAR